MGLWDAIFGTSPSSGGESGSSGGDKSSGSSGGSGGSSKETRIRFSPEHPDKTGVIHTDTQRTVSNRGCDTEKVGHNYDTPGYNSQPVDIPVNKQ